MRNLAETTEQAHLMILPGCTKMLQPWNRVGGSLFPFVSLSPWPVWFTNTTHRRKTKPKVFSEKDLHLGVRACEDCRVVRSCLPGTKDKVAGQMMLGSP